MISEMDELALTTERLVLASRALVGIAARSIAEAEEEVTITQFRVLVVLQTRGPLTSSGLGDVLGTAPSSVTRLCDRLEAKRMIDRLADPTDRRTRLLSLTPKGRRLVTRVTETRRKELARIVETLTSRQRTVLLEALEAFNDASGELPDPTWLMDADVAGERVG